MKQAAVFAVVLSFSAAGAAQSPAQPPAQSPSPERATEPRKPSLNLKLDEADLRSLSRGAPEPREQPGERAADTLPSLGGDARALERAKPRTPTVGGPYPMDTENTTR